MTKIKKFFRQYNKAIQIALAAVTLILATLTVLHFTNVIDVNNLIRFRYFAILYFPTIALWFILFFENQNSNMRTKIKNLLKRTFPIILVLQLLVTYNIFFVQDVPLETIGRYGYLIFGAFLVSILALLWTHRKEALSKQEDCKTSHAIAILILILLTFTLLKAPFFETSFTGEHAMKYNAHVEPAMHMKEHESLLWNQKKYLSDPIENPQNISQSFGAPPLHEWGIVGVSTLFPDNSIELNTRLFTHALGILIIILSYVFLSGWLTKKQSLIITFLIAMNPIIQLVSFVTVQDSWLIIFTMLSLICINRYLKKEDISALFWSGIFLGMGIATKISIFLWLFPIMFVILAFYSKSLPNFIKNILVVSVSSAIPFFAFTTSLRYLPQDTSDSLVKFSLWILASLVLFYILKNYHEKINNICERILEKKRYMLGFGLLLLISAILFLQFINVERYMQNFLTDTNLMFNINMYIYMLNTQFKNYMTSYVFYFGILGFFALLLTKEKKQQILILAFIVGSLVYWFFASKSMFFHNYYTHILIITFCIAAGSLIYYFSNIFKPKMLSILITLIMLVILFPLTFNANVERLGQEEYRFIAVAEFLKNQNISEDGLFVRPGTVHTATSIISLYSNIPSFPGERLLGLEDRRLSKYNIKYVLIQEDEGYDYLNKVINSNSRDAFAHRVSRDQLIEARLNQESIEDDKKEVEIEYSIESQLEYVLTVDDISIYKVKP